LGQPREKTTSQNSNNSQEKGTHGQFLNRSERLGRLGCNGHKHVPWWDLQHSLGSRMALEDRLGANHLGENLLLRALDNLHMARQPLGWHVVIPRELGSNSLQWHLSWTRCKNEAPMLGSGQRQQSEGCRLWNRCSHM
jgi:hypothetical protein